MAQFISGYPLRGGSTLDRALLVKWVQRTYRELYPDYPLEHLAQTVGQYLSGETPLWWVVLDSAAGSSGDPSLPFVPIACLWVGNAVDQAMGDRHAHIFLLYVAPEYRRQGIGAALLRHAEQWARERGDRQIGLQVFVSNQPALNLYEKLGYQPQAYWMVKLL